MNYQERKIQEHYAAWGGEGLDSLLTKAEQVKKGKTGGIYDLHQAQILRNAKKASKEQSPLNEKSLNIKNTESDSFMENVKVKKSPLQ